MIAPAPATLVGQDETHLCPAGDAREPGVLVHRDAIDPFRSLRAAAHDAGFDLTIHSGFRSFERQRSIWNRKVKGELPVLDNHARPLDIRSLTDGDLVLAILRWSALPGASRHHWGTDLDVYDAAAIPPGYAIELVPAEVDPGGMFGPLHAWLDEQIANRTSFGFYRPYDRDRGGIAPERWHLSYSPIAARYAEAVSADLLRQTIASSGILLEDTVLAHLDEIVDRFVQNVNPDLP